jgi:hypothetical protein
MGTNNAINCHSTGIIKYDGAGTFSSTTTTAHDVLVGAASNGITNITPGSTSTVLRSGGAAADPAWTSAFTVSSSDVMQNTKQPYFQVYLSTNKTNVTGANVLYTIPWDTVVTDQASNFTTGASANFAAPVTGQYFFSVGIEVYGLAAGNTSGLFQLTRSDGAFWTGGLFNFANLANSGGACIPTASFALGMTAAQTIKVQLQVAGGTQIVNVAGGTSTQYLTYWSGFLIC